MTKDQRAVNTKTPNWYELPEKADEKVEVLVADLKTWVRELRLSGHQKLYKIADKIMDYLDGR